FFFFGLYIPAPPLIYLCSETFYRRDFPSNSAGCFPTPIIASNEYFSCCRRHQ
ncbi:hypothetical protein LINPERHAP1_LOCUS18035, partial [Linum perenne]